jgi:hypothetical protein
MMCARISAEESEHKVWTTGQIANVQAVAESHMVNQSADDHLWFRIF